MLTPFPDFLMFGFFSPTLLRCAAAAIFIYLAYYHFKHKEAIARIDMPIVGGGMWVAWVAVIIEMAVSASLFFGYYVQYAAVLGLLGAVKQFVWRNAYPTFFILPRTTSALLIAILLSLLVTGAGALAFDLPL